MVFRRAEARAQARPRSRDLWYKAFLGFFLLAAAWATLQPYDAAPDEREHVVHAAAVAGGDWFAEPAAAARGTGAYQTVPEGLIHDGSCFHSHREAVPICQDAPDGDKTLVTVGSVTGRYNPLYYFVVGVPLRLMPTWTGLLAARLLNAAMVSALLACAVVGARQWSRYRTAAVGVLVAATPMTLFLAGQVGPNALEIAAGTALFTALYPLARAGGAERRAMAHLAGLSGCVIAVLRPLGPLFLLVALAAMLFPLARHRARLADLVREQAVRRWSVALVLFGGFGALWTVAFKASEVAVSPGEGVVPSLKMIVFDQLGDLFQETVGVLGWREFRLPPVVVFSWYSAFGILALLPLLVASRTARAKLGILAITSLAVTVLPEALTASKYGYGWQGRYVLPLSVGLPIVGAYILGDEGILRTEDMRRLGRSTALLLIPMHLIALWFSEIRYFRGLPGTTFLLHLNPYADRLWSPPSGAYLPGVLALAGAGALLRAVWSATSDLEGAGAAGAGPAAQPAAQSADVRAV